MSVADPWLPRLYRVDRYRSELTDVFTLELSPSEGTNPPFLPGQFNMLYLFGVGEVPISISGDPDDPARLLHTIRAVGTVTDALQRLRPGDPLGVRGPYGNGWPLAGARGRDVIIVTGGIGLAPLRPAIYRLLAEREHYGEIIILYGARTPHDILYQHELEQWRGRFDLQVEVTVDHAEAGWHGRVGVVPGLLEQVTFDPHNSIALVCGPEIMMRFTVQALQQRGVADESIYVSMERNMKCGIGLCGHCQLGGQFVCKDGPVFGYPRVARAFRVWEF